MKNSHKYEVETTISDKLKPKQKIKSSKGKFPSNLQPPKKKRKK